VLALTDGVLSCFFTQDERRHNKGEGAPDRNREWLSTEARSLLERLFAIHTTEQTVRGYFPFSSRVLRTAHFFICRYVGPTLELEMDGNYISRLEYVYLNGLLRA